MNDCTRVFMHIVINPCGKQDDEHRCEPRFLDYYKVLEVDYDATDEKIRINYLKLALKWHPDKHKGNDAVTVKFQEINEAYKGLYLEVCNITCGATMLPRKAIMTVLSDPAKRLDYDLTGNYEIDKYSLREYLTRFKGMILTCNGLGIDHAAIWTHQLMDTNELVDK
ncbi:hypothetical protein C5167_032471 [Papaver somniferum]|uniref:J domain-containing protein n=1 Tax=Papaver somniferum TaxID=3469 RepID=A0A4Y7KAJ0_PAPSO|nr:hypothetical protein C5167_032471 [Papaver somniferum]